MKSFRKPAYWPLPKKCNSSLQFFSPSIFNSSNFKGTGLFITLIFIFSFQAQAQVYVVGDDMDVGIGLSLPVARLHVDQATNDIGLQIDGSGNFAIFKSSNTEIAINSVGDNPQIKFDRSGTFWSIGNDNDLFVISNSAALGAANRFSLTSTGHLTISQALTLGGSATDIQGTIRWTGTDFEGFDGSTWNSFTSGGGGSQDISTNGTAGEISITGGSSIMLNVEDGDADPTNENQTVSSTDGTVTIVQTGEDFDLSVENNDNSSTNEIQTISKDGANLVTLSDGGGTFTDEVDDADADPTNEYNTSAQLIGNNLEITDGGGTKVVNLSTFNNTDTDDQTLSISGSDLTISEGNTVTLPADLVDDADADPTNEYITSAILSGNNLEITDGGGTKTVDLTTIITDTDDQTLSISGADLTISEGNTVTLPADLVDDADADPTNEYLTSAMLNGNNLEITDGGGTKVVNLSSFNNTDTDDQTLSIAGSDLTISEGNTVTLPTDLVDDADADPTNEYITSAMLSGNNLEITDGGGTKTVDLTSIITDTDDQTLSISGNDLTISEGNTVTLPTDLVDDADADPTNEYITSAMLSGNNLEITDGGGHESS